MATNPTHRRLALEPLRQPGGLPLLSWLGNRIANRPNPWLYDPMFAAVAAYLGVRYDRSLPTLLWTAQDLAIDGLGALLRVLVFVGVGGGGAAGLETPAAVIQDPCPRQSVH